MTFDTALYWRSLGVSTIPVEPGGKRPLISWRRWQSELPSVSLLAEWFYETDRNIAVITDGESGLVVLDFDDSSSFARWARDNRDVTDATRIESTPNGYHGYLFVTQPVESQEIHGIEIKSGGQCCNVAPSRCNGKPYTVIQERPVLKVKRIEEALSRLETATARVKEKRADPGWEKDAPAFSLTQAVAGKACASTPSNRLVTRIKSKLSILDLLLRYTEPKPSSRDGTWWLMRCPNPKHYDEHPSFWANAKLGICGCYVPWCREGQPGGKAMDAISLYAWMHNLSNAEAIKQLAEQLEV